MSAPDTSEFDDLEDPVIGQVRDALRRKRTLKVEALADLLDVPPKRVRHAIERLQQSGYRIPPEAAGQVELLKVPPSQSDVVHKLPLALLDGDVVRFGVVSDTHLGNKECALSELHLAYDYFEREEIGTVLHAGDFCDGVGIYRGQHNSLTHHTYEQQVEHLEECYPRRDGIVTKGIGGNHDLEGEFGKAGADPVKALSNRRDDIQYLGAYEAYLEVENGAVIHLLHGSGGMSYSFSYKAQKLVEAYPSGRKPSLLIVGHWHVQGSFSPRGVHVTFPGCFEWKTDFMVRKGLAPAVGFHVLELQLGDDGSVVEHTPRWKPTWEGRQIAVST